MNEQDTIQRFIIEDKDIRGEIVHLNESMTSAFLNFEYPSELKVLLGQCLCATVLMSATIKFEGKISLQLQGQGIVRLVLVQVTHDRVLRGIIKWDGETEGKGFRELIGDAQLAITIEPDKGKRYQGLVPLEHDRLDACLETYFLRSEQIPTQIWLSASQTGSAGFLIQKLPGHGDELSSEEWEHISILARSVTDDELLNLPNETMLFRLFHQETVRIFDLQPVTYRCMCSRSRCESAIVSLGKTEIDDIIDEGNPVSMSCDFCGTEYQFSIEEIKELKKQVIEN